MQDFDIRDFGVRVRPYRPAESLSKEELEGMKGDPVAMYMHSLRTHSRLPDDLHESMLLHSFDPAMAHNVKSYLEWVRTCAERDEIMASVRRRERLLDRLVVGSVSIGTLGYILLLLWVISK